MRRALPFLICVAPIVFVVGCVIGLFAQDAAPPAEPTYHVLIQIHVNIAVAEEAAAKATWDKIVADCKAKDINLGQIKWVGISERDRKTGGPDWGAQCSAQALVLNQNPTALGPVLKELSHFLEAYPRTRPTIDLTMLGASALTEEQLTKRAQEFGQSRPKPTDRPGIKPEFRGK